MFCCFLKKQLNRSIEIDPEVYAVTFTRLVNIDTVTYTHQLRNK